MSELVGGQAIFEGVMVRQGPRWVAAARRPDASIALTEGRASNRDRWWWRVPVLRGALATFESIRVGLAATRWSQDLSRRGEPASATERVLAVVVGLGVLAAFLVIPTSVARALFPAGWAASITEGICGLGLFVAYLAAIGRFPSIRRTFEYHGAEHMAVSAWEHEGEVSVVAARRHSVRHPRCGTDLLLMVFLISIVVFRFLPGGFSFAAVAARLVAVPVVAGLAFEVLRVGGTSPVPWVRAVLAGPGLAAQRLTTAPPADDQVEVAVAAMASLVGAEASPRR